MKYATKLGPFLLVLCSPSGAHWKAYSQVVVLALQAVGCAGCQLLFRCFEQARELPGVVIGKHVLVPAADGMSCSAHYGGPGCKTFTSSLSNLPQAAQELIRLFFTHPD